MVGLICWTLGAGVAFGFGYFVSGWQTETMMARWRIEHEQLDKMKRAFAFRDSKLTSERDELLQALATIGDITSRFAGPIACNHTDPKEPTE